MKKMKSKTKVTGCYKDFLGLQSR